jgi:hypothetical protein
LKAVSFALLLSAAAALAPTETAAHHGKKEEHAQPAVSRGQCTWLRAGKTYASLTACTKGGHAKRSCRSACK